MRSRRRHQTTPVQPASVAALMLTSHELILIAQRVTAQATALIAQSRAIRARITALREKQATAAGPTTAPPSNVTPGVAPYWD